MPEQVTVRSCPACGHRRQVFNVISGKTDIEGTALRLATCRQCRTAFQPTAPSQEALSRWYEYMGHSVANMKLTAFHRQRLEHLMGSVEQFVPCGRLLEIGCGGGLLLQIAEERGWNVYGTEISASCSDALRQRWGDRLWQGELPAAPFEPGSFDLVVFMEVVEHLPDPLAYLRAAYHLLRRGGSVYLTTPNFRGVSARIWKTKWRIVGDEHVNYFNARSVSVLLKRAGYGSVSVRATGLDARHLRRWAVKALGEGFQPDAADTGIKRGLDRIRAVKRALAVGAIDVGHHMLSRLKLGDTLKVRAVKLN